MPGAAPFLFPPHMTRDVAQALLAEAYREIDAGKVLRRALKEQREAGWDPPHDVQYVGEPALAVYPEGLGVGLASDIRLYEEFEGMDECTDIFEACLAAAIVGRLEKTVGKWLKRHPPRGQTR